MNIERTRQQLDPVGTLASRTLAVAFAIGAFAYGVTMTIRTLDQVSNLALAILALVWLAAASVAVVVGSSPHRAPFTRSTHVTVQLLCVGSIVLCTASQWGTNRFVQDDFAPVAVGIILLALGPYRPAQEIAAAGSLTAILAGFMTLLEAPGLGTSVPAMSFVLVGMTPILALSYASASFSGSLVNALEQWQVVVGRFVARSTRGKREGIARLVRADRVSILNHDVVPFFNDLMGRGVLTPDDKNRAREIANSIRTLMVAEADRTWLEVIARDDGVPADRVSRAIDDPEGRAARMATDQRTALRAVTIALLKEPLFEQNTLRIALAGADSMTNGELTARLEGSDFLVRSLLAPYFAVMRNVFQGVQVDFHDSTLTLKFSYEQR